MTPGALLTSWARLLIGSLRRAGVRDVVISPGSRSTPFTWAALREPGLRCRSIVDERSAAFFALGQARVTGRPSLLICTSGSAAANYHPAVVEADRAALPLLLLTADRPLELQHAEAPQTIDQTRLYGGHARAFFDLGAPDPAESMLRGVARIAAQATHTALSPRPGPVQLNARARKPLEPTVPVDEEDHRIAALVDALLERGPTAARAPLLEPPADAVAELAAELASARRVVIAAGPMAAWQAPPAEEVARLASLTGAALFLEATSQLRFATEAPVLDALDRLLDQPSSRDRFAPDLVLEIGPPPVSTAWREYLARSPGLRRHVVWPYGWSDPHNAAASVWAVAPGRLVTALADRVEAEAGPAGGRDRGWVDELTRASREARAVVDEGASAPRPDGRMAEGAAVRAAVDALSAGGVLMVGNSLPVRDVDRYCAAGPRGLTVLSQRGAAGIDGLVSGAAGSASASGRPTLLLLGDVSLLHDLGGLAAARDVEAPLAILVLDNGGGRIFDRLPLAASGALDEAEWRYWATPPGLDFEHAAAAFGIRFRAAAAAAEVGDAVREALDAPGATLLHAPVAPPGDPLAPNAVPD